VQGYALSMHKIPVGVLGASGYAGRELCELVVRHPSLSLGFASANERRGECMRVGPVAVTLVAPEDAPFASTPLVFSALPHGVSGEWVGRARAAGARVVDLSADLRLDPSVPYGLTEVARSAVKGADVVANPGCYATAVLLALWPLVARGLIPSDATIAVAAASGVTGAGNGPRRDLLFAEVTEDYRAYAVGNTHRHLAEMRATLAGWGGNADLVFTPHLLPVARGILATITVPVAEPMADPLAVWAEHYAGETFVEIVRETPSLREVAHRNVARIAVVAAEGVRRPAVVITAAIDNLLKGAAGQAVQNGNLMLGLAESAGLPV
jgi:N-acetyl-gamma-glutamyl-phosphate reductase